MKMHKPKGFQHSEPTVKTLEFMKKDMARKYLAKELKEGGKGEPKAWHKKELSILKRKVK
jgi:hypothetical protein